MLQGLPQHIAEIDCWYYFINCARDIRVQKHAIILKSCGHLVSRRRDLRDLDRKVLFGEPEFRHNFCRARAQLPVEELRKNEVSENAIKLI